MKMLLHYGKIRLVEQQRIFDTGIEDGDAKQVILLMQMKI